MAGIVVEENTLQVHVSSLRKLLSRLHRNVHGRGYKYVGPMPQSVVTDVAVADRCLQRRGMFRITVPNVSRGR